MAPLPDDLASRDFPCAKSSKWESLVPPVKGKRGRGANRFLQHLGEVFMFHDPLVWTLAMMIVLAVLAVSR
jgi:hypothetical protein